ncbi:hypothetical protein [Brevundimonas sp.]|uniref:hypothetical protein n=1 Tax=Brevundimonas sp. TaxID=1871086 RepID=UPI0025F54DC5|nr:hypothetical protein [Brevundimonas sp.]
MKTPAELRAEAIKCRRLAAGITDRTTVEALRACAEEAEARAEAMDRQALLEDRPEA